MSSTPFSQLVEAAKEAKYEVVPKGPYAVVCKSATAVKASTGKDMIKITASVVVGPFKGSNIFTQQVLSPDNAAAVAIFLKAMNAFGVTEEWLAELPPRADGGPDMEAVARALQGRAAMADVDIRQWNDEDRNEITRFKKPTAEEEAAIKEALEALGSGDPFGAPTTTPADPFAAAAAGGGDPTAKPADEPF